MTIEKTLIDYLISQNIDDVNGEVYPMTPKQPLPDNYIVIDKTGSRLENGIPTATIAIQSISSESLQKAIQINDAVKNAMKGFPQIENVFGVHLQTDYNFTNSLTKQYRYQAVFSVTYIDLGG